MTDQTMHRHVCIVNTHSSAHQATHTADGLVSSISGVARLLASDLLPWRPCSTTNCPHAPVHLHVSPPLLCILCTRIH